MQIKVYLQGNRGLNEGKARVRDGCVSGSLEVSDGMSLVWRREFK